MPSVTPASAAPPILNSYDVPGALSIAGEYPGTVSPATSAEKLTRFLDAGITAFIDLTGAPDGLSPYAGLLTALGRECGMQIVYERHYYIRDMHVCSKDEMTVILAAIDQHLADGGAVYVHCWGGVGRPGSVVGCRLVQRGRSGKDALDEVQRVLMTMSLQKTHGSRRDLRKRRGSARWYRSLGMKPIVIATRFTAVCLAPHSATHSAGRSNSHRFPAFARTTAPMAFRSSTRAHRAGAARSPTTHR